MFFKMYVVFKIHVVSMKEIKSNILFFVKQKNISKLHKITFHKYENYF